MTDELILLAMIIRVGSVDENGRVYRPYKGGINMNCPRCGHDCYVGPATLIRINAGTAALCNHCCIEVTAEAAKNDPDGLAVVGFLPLTNKKMGE